MNVKKEVAERITSLLRNQLSVINTKIRNNKYEFSKLEKEQTILKRSRVEIDSLLKEVEKRSNSNNTKEKS